MLWQSSYFIWSFLCLLTLDQIHVSSGIICRPGYMATHSRDKCEPCPEGQFNSKPTDNNECRNCDPCENYSQELSRCTPTSNTKCRCLQGFTSVDKTQKRCKCKEGFGIKTVGNEKVCEKCPHNTFTNRSNTECQLLPQFTQKIPGNATFDVSDRYETKAFVHTSSTLPVSQTSNSTSMTPTTSRNLVSTPTTSHPDSSKHALWLASLVAFLLLILILKLSRCPEKKTDIVRQGSACGKPVEESGEKFI